MSARSTEDVKRSRAARPPVPGATPHRAATGAGWKKTGHSTFLLRATCTGIHPYPHATGSMGEGNRVDNWRSALEIGPKTEEASSGYVRGPAPHHPVLLRTLCIRLRRVPLPPRLPPPFLGLVRGFWSPISLYFRNPLYLLTLAYFQPFNRLLVPSRLSFRLNAPNFSTWFIYRLFSAVLVTDFPPSRGSGRFTSGKGPRSAPLSSTRAPTSLGAVTFGEGRHPRHASTPCSSRSAGPSP